MSHSSHIHGRAHSARPSHRTWLTQAVFAALLASPAGAQIVCDDPLERFTQGVPPGWTVVDAAGGGLLWWQFREEGYFIDFSEEDLPIFFGNYLADGLTWELFALAGLDFRLSQRWSFFFEGRYRWSEDELNKDFSGFGTIDLSSIQLAGGFSYNF